MPFSSIGDLASNLIHSQANVLAKRNLQKFATELTTGVTSDVKSALRNDLARQVHWQQDLASNKVLEKTLSEAVTRTQAKLATLSSISDTMTSLANDISTALGSQSNIALDTLSKNGRDSLDQAVSLLNFQVAGRSLFSGSATNLPALAPSVDILSAVRTYIGPSTIPSDIIQKVKDWIGDATDGFDSVAFSGNDEPISPIRISSNRSIKEASKADNPAIKATIENMVLVAISADQSFALDNSSKASLLKIASTGLRNASSEVTELAAGIGQTVSELLNAKSRASTENVTIEQIRSNTLGIDEFEVASKLQQSELQLEKIYTVTARSARMSLLEFLR